MPKGIYKRTEEMLKKTSERMSGRKLSEETKIKIGIASKGRPSFWKGKKRSEETKRKIKLNHKGRTGQPHLKATKTKMSLSAKKYIKNNPRPLGNKHPNWKGGKVKMGHDYIQIYNPTHPYANVKHYVLEHRLVMEKHIGRILLPTEVVHHINGIVDDNRIENLMLFSNNAEHSKYENKLKGDY